MERERIIEHLSILGGIFKLLSEKKEWPGFDLGINQTEYEDMQTLIKKAEQLNPWFTEEQTLTALKAWAEELTVEKLSAWTDMYSYAANIEKKVGVIMAGNIPLVGLHDLISVLLSGHSIIIRPSSDDHILIRMVEAVLRSLDASYAERIHWADGKLKGFDAVIATGSNNTSRYFEHYFSKVPNIIRKNRNGIAILSGNESEEELKALGTDIFQYYGLGCRNVSKMYVPEGYDLNKFFEGIYGHHEVIHHNKYGNNFDYYRSVFLLNADDILENGFLLLKRSPDLASPMASLNYEEYKDITALRAKLKEQKDEIQCIVSQEDTAFGFSQNPSLIDYADGVDTMAFLNKL